ncbi:MAG: NAD(P)/FAD-dependent oxidoreductase [Clostridiaceae bacterium]|jgi:glycerol-3-phosphate dehydrogenase|nr:NAD(P)/FAD-dependent oxidoreductase [Clostridiaceae bacterium]
MKNKDIKKIIKDVCQVSPDIKTELKDGCVVLSGELDDWQTIYEAGAAAASKRYLGVINNVRLKGKSDGIPVPDFFDEAAEGLKPDVLVIGGGIVGAACARELKKYNLDVLLTEKSYDVATGASGRNDGCVHVGIDLHKGQQKLIYNGRGNAMYDGLCKDLDVALEKKGHMILFKSNAEGRFFSALMKLRAKQNGIPGVKYLPREEALKIETGLPSWCSGVLYMPIGGIVSPYKLTVALAENAAQNGAKILLNTTVLGMKTENGKIVSVKTNRGTIYPKVVINAAGIYADKIAEFADDRTFTIHPRKGTNLILDKKRFDYAVTSITKSPFTKLKNNLGGAESMLASATSKSHTKGGGIVRTIDGNVLVGPNAREIFEREDYATDNADIDEIINKQKATAEKLTRGDVITYFSGTRAATYEEDFVVRKGIRTKNIIETAGIQSPGITAAPAIAEDAAKWAAEMLKAGKNPSFDGIRRGVPHLAQMDAMERDALIKKNPDYGIIVCRCEEISKGEILDALRSPLPAAGTVDGIKRRVRPGMGRCQGGFCMPLVVKIIADELGIPEAEVTKAGRGSLLLYGDKNAEGVN